MNFNKKIYPSSLPIMILLLILLYLFSCRKDEGKSDWDISVLAPFLKSTLNINNIVTDSLIRTNPDSSISIVYENDLFEINLDSLVSMPDTLTTKYYHLPVGLFAVPGQKIFDITDETKFDFEDARIIAIRVKSGSINFNVINKIDNALSCKYTLPGTFLNNIPFEVTETIPASSDNGGVFNKKYDISGYTFYLTGKTGLKANTLCYEYVVTTDPNGDSIFIDKNDSLIINVNAGDIVIDYAKGYFGEQNFTSGDESSKIDIFKRFTGGAIGLEDVDLTVNISNGFGVDIRAYINNFTSINSKTGNSVSLTGPIINHPVNISRATETYDAFDPAVNSEYSISFDNSNIESLIENLPDEITYLMSITTNPMGNNSCGNDFIYYNECIKASLDMEIPVSVIANQLTIVDTAEFNFSEQKANKNITEGIFKLIVDNGFPFDAKVQLFLMDNNNVITDSLLNNNNTIYAAPVGANMRVYKKRTSVLEIPVSETKLNKIYATKKILIRARFTTIPANKYLKIYNNYNIDFTLVGDFNLSVGP